MILTLVFGIFTGVIAALRQNTWVDQAAMTFALLGVSIPNFWLGLMMIVLFAVHLGWLPSGGYIHWQTDLWGWFRTTTLAAVSIAMLQMGLLARITRSTMLEVLRQDYIRTARAKGLSNRVVLMKHALRNAAVPILTVIGIGIAVLMGGAVVTESVFGLPGLGRLTVEAVLSRDFPTIQTVILMFSVVYVLINLLIDISYTIFDPRIRY